MTFITTELLTCIGIAVAVGLSANGSCTASAQAGMYMTRYTYTSSGKGGGWDFIIPLIPIIIAGVLAIYGFIIAILLSMKFQELDSNTNIVKGYQYLAAGLAVGLSTSSSGNALVQFLNDYIMLYSPMEVGTGTGRQAEDIKGTGTSNNSCTSNSNSASDIVEPLLLSDSSLSPNHHHQHDTTKVKTFPTPNIHFYMTMIYIEAIGLYGLIVALLLIK